MQGPDFVTRGDGRGKKKEKEKEPTRRSTVSSLSPLWRHGSHSSREEGKAWPAASRPSLPTARKVTDNLGVARA